MYSTCDKAGVYCIVKTMAAAAAKKLPMIFDEFDLPSRDECTTTSFQDYIVILLLTLVLAHIYTVKLRKLIKKIYKNSKHFGTKKH